MTAKWLCCLALVGWCLMPGHGWAQTPEATDESMGAGYTQKLIVVTVWAHESAWSDELAWPAESAWPQDEGSRGLEASYQQELSELLSDLGVHYHFAGLEEATSRSFAGRIVVLRMLEQTAARTARDYLKGLPRSALAWTHASGSDITPFCAVDLHALRRFLGMESPRKSNNQGLRQQGVAIARVAAHEIFHMLTRSRAHSDHGLMKPALSRTELLAARAPSWTASNRLAARKLLHPVQVRVLAAVSGAQSTATSSK
ncbi:MAG: hypothetical protein KIT83_17855 [Bryobacterales bacterium]|nr:hypothetical protein [Bryobacterales bacterium]